MILILFGLFLVLSFVMIYIGLTNQEESAQALIGFFFLFLLGLTIIQGNLEYQIGETTNTTYSYENGNLSFTSEVTTYDYNNFNSSNTHYFGYFLAVAAALGFAFVFFGLKGGWGKNEFEG